MSLITLKLPTAVNIIQCVTDHTQTNRCRPHTSFKAGRRVQHEFTDR